jgi:hypothetical protein
VQKKEFVNLVDLLKLSERKVQLITNFQNLHLPGLSLFWGEVGEGLLFPSLSEKGWGWAKVF